MSQRDNEEEAREKAPKKARKKAKKAARRQREEAARARAYAAKAERDANPQPRVPPAERRPRSRRRMADLQPDTRNEPPKPAPPSTPEPYREDHGPDAAKYYLKFYYRLGHPLYALLFFVVLPAPLFYLAARLPWRYYGYFCLLVVLLGSLRLRENSLANELYAVRARLKVSERGLTIRNGGFSKVFIPRDDIVDMYLNEANHYLKLGPLKFRKRVLVVNSERSGMIAVDLTRLRIWDEDKLTRKLERLYGAPLEYA